MASLIEWKVPQSVQPRAEDYSYDLERALSSVVGLHSIVPPDAFTADTLGIERAGNGVLVDDGLVLTIGYLITEAETVWVHLGDGRVVQGHALGFDQETGFGLVQTLGKIDLPVLERGSSSNVDIGERIVVGGAGLGARRVHLHGVASDLAHQPGGQLRLAAIFDADEQHRRLAAGLRHQETGVMPSSSSRRRTRSSISSRIGRTASTDWPAGSGSSQFS